MKINTVILAVLLTLCGCATQQRSYPDNKQHFLGDGIFTVPDEFKRGTASLANVEAWSYSLLNEDYDPQELKERRTRLELKWRPLETATNASMALFVNDSGDTGRNRAYLAFLPTTKGFRYLDRLGFASYRPMPKDSSGRFQIFTAMVAGKECLLSVLVLKPSGFELVSQRDLPCGDGTTEGPNPVDQLFEAPVLTEQIVSEVFNVKVRIVERE